MFSEAMSLTTAKDKLFDLFSRGVTTFTGICSDVLNNLIGDVCIEAFDQGIEIEIENTIRSLIDVSVHEDRMIEGMQKFLGSFERRDSSKNWLSKAQDCSRGLREIPAL